MSKISKIKLEEFKWKCLNYLDGKKCKRCNTENWCIASYDFHHIKGNKDFEISKAINKDWKEVKKELDKCEVLCSNCHREKHYFKEL